MSRLPDEQWDMIKDSIDKKNVARSSRNRRTHCGKGGSVKFPSDFMTKKELNAMNGEVKSYRLNEPMTYEEIKDETPEPDISNNNNKSKVCTPAAGRLSFDCVADEALDMVKTILTGKHVHMIVIWDTEED